MLFAGSATLEKVFVDGIAAAPEGSSPLDAIAAGLEASAVVFEEVRDHARKRQAILAANAELQERELIKLARLADAGAAALRRRGVDEPAASLAAEAGMAVLRVSFERWTTGRKGQSLRELLADSLDRAEGGRRVRIATPFGEYPFVFRRVERREDGVAILGTVAGVDSAVVFDRDDARRAAKVLAVPAAAVLLLFARAARG